MLPATRENVVVVSLAGLHQKFWPGVRVVGWPDVHLKPHAGRRRKDALIVAGITGVQPATCRAGPDRSVRWNYPRIRRRGGASRSHRRRGRTGRRRLQVHPRLMPDPPGPPDPGFVCGDAAGLAASLHAVLVNSTKATRASRFSICGAPGHRGNCGASAESPRLGRQHCATITRGQRR